MSGGRRLLDRSFSGSAMLPEEDDDTADAAAMALVRFNGMAGVCALRGGEGYG